jgi:uncharacterized membrane protein
MRRRVGLAAGAIGAWLGCGAASAATITVKEYAVQPGMAGAVNALNNRHQAVVSTYPPNNPALATPILRSQGSTEAIPFPPEASDPNAVSINEAGMIVGSYGISHGEAYKEYGFLWSAGAVTTIAYPGAISTRLTAINDAGQIVGTADPVAFLTQNGSFTTIEYPRATHTLAVTISNRGIVAGWAYTNQGKAVGFTWQNGKFRRIAYPGSRETRIRAGSRNGLLTGDAILEDGTVVSFVYRKGVFSVIPPFGSSHVEGASINDSGSIVGQTADAPYTTVYYSAKGQFVPVPLLPNGDTPALYLLNDDGVAAGFATRTRDGLRRPMVATCTGPDC